MTSMQYKVATRKVGVIKDSTPPPQPYYMHGFIYYTLDGLGGSAVHNYMLIHPVSQKR